MKIQYNNKLSKALEVIDVMEKLNLHNKLNEDKYFAYVAINIDNYEQQIKNVYLRFMINFLMNQI